YLAWQAIKDDYPVQAEVYRELLKSTAKWILSEDAYNPMTKGLRYASISTAACGGLGSVGAAFGCWGTGANSGPADNIETIQSLSFFYLMEQRQNIQSPLDGIYNSTYARTGYRSLYPGDGNWSEATAEAGHTTSV